MTPPKKPTARILSKELKYDGFLKMFSATIEFDRHEGGTQVIKRDIMDRGHAVAVLAYDPVRDEIALVNEMRPGALWAGDACYTDNLIAGNIEKDETAIVAATRETEQETGLELKNPILVHPGAFVSSGGTSEKIAIVAGIVDTSNVNGTVHGCVNENENIKVTVLKAEEFIRQVTTGHINDLKTLVAGYWLIENRPKLKLAYAAGQKAASPKKAAEAFRPK